MTPADLTADSALLLICFAVPVFLAGGLVVSLVWWLSNSNIKGVCK